MHVKMLSSDLFIVCAECFVNRTSFVSTLVVLIVEASVAVDHTWAKRSSK